MGNESIKEFEFALSQLENISPKKWTLFKICMRDNISKYRWMHSIWFGECYVTMSLIL